MKKGFLVLAMLLVCVSAQALPNTVTAKVISVDIGARDYIWIEIEYDIEGRKVINSYPMDVKNMVGKTKAQIVAWIKANVEYQCDRYIEAEFKKKYNADAIVTKLNTLVGKEYIKDSAELFFDVDSDGIADRKFIIEMDGSYVEEIIP